MNENQTVGKIDCISILTVNNKRYYLESLLWWRTSDNQ